MAAGAEDNPSVSTYTWTLFLHLLGALLLAGGMSVAGAASLAARRRERPSEIAAVLGAARMGVALVAVGSLFILVFGFWLSEESGRGLDEGWLGGSLGLFLLAIVLGALGGQRPKRARLVAERLATEGSEGDEELSRLLRDVPSLVLNGIAAAAILAVLLLMVWQPA